MSTLTLRPKVTARDRDRILGQRASEECLSLPALKAKIVREWQRISPTRRYALYKTLWSYRLTTYQNAQGQWIRSLSKETKPVLLRDYWTATLRGDL